MATSKNKWLDTIQGFENFGLRWGGNFSGFYNPVHFDIKDKFPDLEYLRMLYNNNDLVNKKFVKI